MLASAIFFPLGRGLLDVLVVRGMRRKEQMDLLVVRIYVRADVGGAMLFAADGAANRGWDPEHTGAAVASHSGSGPCAARLIDSIFTFETPRR